MGKLLFACACGLTLTIAGTVLAASEAIVVTGKVEKFNKESGRMVIGGQTFIMEPSGPLALTPQVGHRVTLLYEERNGQKVITRIGQSRAC